MLGMSLINVAVKSGPPSPCPFCCSVLVPLQCPQSQEQIETLMMDIQPHPPLRSSHNPSAGLGSPPSPSSAPRGRQSRGSQPVRQACSPHQFRESRRQPCILTSLALTSSGGKWLSLEDFRNSGERPRRGVEGVSCGRDAMTQLWVVAVPKCLQDCVALLGSHFS